MNCSRSTSPIPRHSFFSSKACHHLLPSSFDSCPPSLSQSLSSNSFTQQRWERWEIYIHFRAPKGRLSRRRSIPAACRRVGCNTLLLAPAKTPAPAAIITPTPHLLHHGERRILRSKERGGSCRIKLIPWRERWRPPWEVGFNGLRTSAPRSSVDTNSLSWMISGFNYMLYMKMMTRIFWRSDE